MKCTRIEKKMKSVEAMFAECWKNDNVTKIKVTNKGSYDGLDNFKVNGYDAKGNKVKKSYIKIEIFSQY